MKRERVERNLFLVMILIAAGVICLAVLSYSTNFSLRNPGSLLPHR